MCIPLILLEFVYFCVALFLRLGLLHGPIAALNEAGVDLDVLLGQFLVAQLAHPQEKLASVAEDAKEADYETLARVRSTALSAPRRTDPTRPDRLRHIAHSGIYAVGQKGAQRKHQSKERCMFGVFLLFPVL